MKAKPNIALFGMAILGDETNGSGIPVLNDLFSRLSRDFNITYYSFQRLDASTVPADIAVHQVVSWPIPVRFKYFLLVLLFGLHQLSKRARMIFSVSVYPTGWWAIMAGKVFNTRVSVQMIALEAVNIDGLGNLAHPKLAGKTRWVCAQADSLVAVAEHQKTVAIGSLPTSRKIHVLPLRINVHKFPFQSRAISFPVKFIHVAYFSSVKDQFTLLETFAKVSAHIPATLTLIGGGYESPAFSEAVRKLGIGDRVVVEGRVSQEALPNYYAGAHVMLHTPVFETGCAVIQEAMASGVVVCGTNVGILSDLGDRYAEIAPVKDADVLADKVLKLIADEKRFAQVQADAHRFITSFEAVWSAGQYREFLFSQIDHPAPA